MTGGSSRAHPVEAKPEAAPVDVLRASAVALAAGIRSGALDARDVVEAHIAEVARVNPRLNAVVATRFDEARAEAAAVRARLDDGDTAPLLGVPCTIKESFALQGMPWTSGLVARRGVTATCDASTVARLRAAGAIPLGVTNTSELCMWMESDNRVYGRTNNPYDARRIVGGSSGGEGAIVGAGASPFGLGSDIGGSIRMPAFFNGVFGHKPSAGRVPGTGQYPNAHGEARRFLTTGPICRRAADLAPLLTILEGADGVDDTVGVFSSCDPARVDIASLTVLDVPDDGSGRVVPALRAAQRRAVGALASRGARVVEASFPAFAHALEIWSAMMSTAGGPSFASLLGDGTPVRAWRELARLVLGRSPHTLPSLGLVVTEQLPRLLPGRTRRFVDEGRALAAELAAALAGDVVMLYPSYSRPAPPHRWPLRHPFDWTYTAILNVMGLPATQVPLGLDDDGVPTGVQVAAAHGADHLTLAVALALEEDLGGWVPPSS